MVNDFKSDSATFKNNSRRRNKNGSNQYLLKTLEMSGVTKLIPQTARVAIWNLNLQIKDLSDRQLVAFSALGVTVVLVVKCVLEYLIYRWNKAQCPNGSIISIRSYVDLFDETRQINVNEVQEVEMKMCRPSSDGAQ